jgi:hypothetical protein
MCIVWILAVLFKTLMNIKADSSNRSSEAMKMEHTTGTAYI